MAVSETGKERCEGNSSVEINGSVSQEEEADAASACHSFWDEAGAGATGAEGGAGLAQQTAMSHFIVPDLQHLQPACETMVGALPADAMKALWPARINPSSRTTDAFTNRDVMAFDWSGGFSFPYTVCQSVRRGEIISPLVPARSDPRRMVTQYQFLNSPQLDMALPI